MNQAARNPINCCKSLSFRTILLTGASSGIGFQAALNLYIQGHSLILPCRNKERSVSTLKRIEEASPLTEKPKNLFAPVLDLADLKSVNTCVENIILQAERIDTLVLNAGLQYTGAPTSRRSAQNYELTIAVNHLGHFALTQQLLPLLQAADNPRIVITSSEVHDPNSPGGRFGDPAGLGDLQGLNSGDGFEMVDGCESFSADKAYKDSKLCNLLFASELDRRLRLDGISMPVIAWAPGLVIPNGNEGFFRYSKTYNQLGQIIFAFAARDLLRFSESVENAGRLLAQISAELQPADSFSYFSNRLLRPGKHSFEIAEVSSEAKDEVLAKNLWDISSKLVSI